MLRSRLRACAQRPWCSAAAVNLQKLTEVFGAEWARTNILPNVIELLKNPHYLYRMTVLKAMSLLAVAMGQAGG